MISLNLIIINKFLTIEIIKKIFKILKFCNLFFILIVILFILNLYLKKSYYKLYKKIKMYRYFIINIIFILMVAILLDLKSNLFFFMKNVYLKIGNENLNIFSIVLSVFWIFSTLILTINNNFLFNKIINSVFFLNLNNKILIFRILTIIFTIIYIFWIFSFMKINMIILGLIITSIGISISTNIQKFFNNYVSGLLILYDKNLKIGDAININGYQGVVSQINGRYTIMRNLDCSEIIVPNEKFLIEIIQNQSLYFSKGNIRINLQISFNNNYCKVLKILIDSLIGIERIIKTPPPLSYITGLNNLGGIDLELSFWILDAVRGVALIKSEVFLNILNLFKINSVELFYHKKFLKFI